MQNKVIVTGGCGYIGSHTVVELMQHDFEVVILDNLSNSSIKILDQIEKITGKKPAFIKIDLTDSLAVKEVFKKHKDANFVLHFAALKAVGESVANPLLYYQNNLFSLINTLAWQTKNNIKNFIFSSSATVYGLPETLPISETAATQRPFSAYGNTKKIAEEILEDLVNANQNFSAISLRYFNPIGAHKSGLIGEIPNGVPNNLMPYITQTAAGIREKLMVFGDDYPTKDGTAVRDYIHVEDLAYAHVLAVKRMLDNKQEERLETFNLGTGTGYSVLEIINTFKEVTKVPLNYEITERRKGDIAQLYTTTELASEKLGWTAKKTLKEMILSSWNWEKNREKN